MLCKGLINIPAIVAAAPMDLDNHLEGRLLFAVPKKGRLQEATLDLLSGSDIQFRRETRLDIALVKNHNIALYFLPAAEIPKVVGRGSVDLGITGSDQVAEYEARCPATKDTGVEEVLNLGFGRCKLQVQVPERGGSNDPRDLIGKNVVTSFTSLTEQYFRKLEDRQEDSVNGDHLGGSNAQNPRKLKTEIIHFGGSVETACRLGVGDGIVDLVESGETMRAARLKPIDTVYESTATLIKSKRPSNQKLVNLIASRINGVITAQKYVFCQYNVARKMLDTATKITPGKRAPTITSLEDPEWAAVSSMVLRVEIATVMDELTACGATDILVFNIANSRTEST